MTTFLFLAGLIVVLGVAVALFRRRNRDDLPEMDGSSISVQEAAEIAYAHLDGIGSPLAAMARACGRGAVGWIAENLCRIIPGAGDPDARVSRKQLRDYLRWARTVQ